MRRRQHGYAGPDMGAEEGGPIRRELLYALGALVLLAFGSFVWNIYGGRDIPRITPQTESYKIAPPDADAPDAAEASALEGVITGEPAAVGDVQVRPGPETPIMTPGARPELTPAPAFVASGPYVAQIAALRSQAGTDQAFSRLASRAPELFAHARLDVERADLGQRGVYYRVRVGYFADLENASRFCDRIRAMGQDCVGVQR